MSLFTPEQQLEIDRRVAQAKAEAHAEYTARAQWFRTWLRQHDQVWVAQRVASSIIGLEAVVAFAVWYLTR
jgi:uncharacterized membrane protein